MPVQTFWLEQTDRVLNGLRRYAGGKACSGPMGYHDAIAFLGSGPGVYTEDGHLKLTAGVGVPHDDPRWPTKCASCEYTFVEDDPFQEWQDRIWVRTDNGQERILRAHIDQNSPIPAAEAGACWNASWMSPVSEDDIYLMVRCPDLHDWAVDSRASNCTLPDDSVHRCWIRHGDPRECHVTVDKNGATCSAGAGSIQTPNWHGFLRNGELVE